MIKKILQKIFKSILFETILVFMIFLSLINASFSIVYNLKLLEDINLFFSFLFCTELVIRYYIYEDKKRYFKTFWLDWIASIPWSVVLLFLSYSLHIPMASMKFFRIFRLLRILRIISIGRSEIGKRLSYRLKKQLERSLPSQLTLLSFISFVCIIIFTIAFKVVKKDYSIGESFYFSIITLISSDSIFEVYDASVIIKTLTLILSFLGIILFNGILIAVIVTQIMDYFIEIRSGKGSVIEKNHFIIIGEHPLVHFLIKEFDNYSKTENKKITITLLKENIDDNLRNSILKENNIDLVIRCGNGYNPEHLEMISLNKSKSVIVLGNFFNSTYQNESITVKTFLTIKRVKELSKKFTPDIFYCVNEKVKKRYMYNQDLSRYHNFDISFFSAKIMVATLINPLKLPIFKELFSFNGNEVHFNNAEKLKGLSFGDLFNNFDNIILLGIERENSVHILPDLEEQIKEGDRILTISESDEKVEESIKKILFLMAKNTFLKNTKETKKSFDIINENKNIDYNINAVIIGVNEKLPHIIEELKKINSSILIVDNQTRESFFEWYKLETGLLIPETVKYISCNFRKLHEIQEVLSLGDYNSVIVLADQDKLDMDEGLIDADTIYKILKIKQLKEREELDKEITLVAEIMSKDSEYAVNSIPDVSFVMSPQILGQLMCIFMIEPKMQDLLRQLVQKGGIDIEIIDYNEEKTINFKQLLSKLIFEKKIGIGYIRDKEIYINPDKNTIIKNKDKIIVMMHGDKGLF